MDEMPRIKKTLEILLPSTLPMAISVLPLALATMLTNSSGVEVPKATTVSPMTRSETLNFLEIAEAPSTSRSAPLMSKTNPSRKKK